MYLLLILAKLELLARYIVLDVLLELLPSQLDAASQGVQLLPREAWDLGQARIWTKKHGLAGTWSALAGRMIPSRDTARGIHGLRRLRGYSVDTVRHLSAVSRGHGYIRLPFGHSLR